MATEAFIKHCHDVRKVSASAVMAAPNGDYLVCDACERIVKKAAHMCPACHGYRFDNDRSRLLNACENLAATPFPVTSAILPRIEWKEIDKVMPEPQIV
jgi:hypothetical protein